MMNRFFTLLFAAFCLTAVGQVPDYVPTDGLVAWYPLSENGVDASGNGHDLIEVGAPIWTIDDAESYCDFDGEGTHFYHPQALFPEVEELTISFRVRIDEFSTGTGVGVVRPIIGKHYSSLDGSFFIHPSPQFVEDYQIELGVWYHITMVVSEVNKIYIDGELVNSTDSPTNGWNPTDHPFMIGGWLNSPWWSNNYSNTALTFDGSMSSVGLWSRELSQDEISLLFNPVFGCMHEQACNYTESANLEDGTCEFVSCHCLTGTIWDAGLGGCIGDGSGDINLDGCVQLNDLLDLLSAYGDCAAEESPWQCGDPLEYQGYDYATVQIGEQCWFAENLQAFQYRDGTEIQSGMAVAFANESILQHGLMYSGGVILDSRSVCPSGWSVPGIASWQALTDFVGENGFEGSESIALRSSDGWTEHPDGIDAFGFAAEPGGFRYNPIHPYWGEFAHRGASGYWWTSTDASPGNLFTASLQGQYFETNYPTSNGMSIRCIKD